MSQTRIEILKRGRSLELWAVVEGDRCYVQEYLDGLEDSARKKLDALLNRTAEHGLPANEQKFKRLSGPAAHGLGEFKSFQERLLCTIEGKRVILTHGFRKKRDDTDPAQIQRAKRLLSTLSKMR